VKKVDLNTLMIMLYFWIIISLKGLQLKKYKKIIMSKINIFLSNRLSSFLYFYKKLRGKVFVKMLLNISVGVLDGLGLAMFLPLLKMVDDTSNNSSNVMGNLKFLVVGMEKIGLNLNLTNVLIILCFFFFLKGIAQYVNGKYDIVLQRNFITNLRLYLCRLLSNISYKSFVKSDVGRIQNSLTGEIGNIMQAFQNYFGAFQQLILVIVYMTFALFVDASFAVLLILGGGLTSLIFTRIYKVTKEKSKELTFGNNQFQGLIIQFIANFKYLKASGSLMKYREKLDTANEEINQNYLKIGKLGVVVTALKEPILIVTVSLVILIQIKFLGGSMGVILVSLLFFYRALSAMMQMQAAYNVFLSVSGSLQNISDFEQELEGQQERKGKDNFQTFQHQLQLKNASFNYGEKEILKNINIEVNRNQTMAFVGESGSGKTTLMNILTGLIPLDQGQFLIDGQNRDALDIDQYQNRIGYITQEAVIFNDTIFNNVSFWDTPTIENKAKFENALKMASCFEFVQSLSDRENTLLGNNGINVSGGQKQRISIARELYKDIDIFVLDEATSALDSETEKIIQESIESLRGKYTILMVAHRLSTIKSADQIILLDNGKILDKGSFSDLKISSSKFKSMVEIQDVLS
jgi:ABC-type multidrug transport system fused ATPase/permease subunit